MQITSRLAHESVKPHKQSTKELICDGLRKLRVGGDQEQIANEIGLEPAQVWKRLNELVKDGKIFDTGITRKLKSGRQGIVWQLTEQKNYSQQSLFKV